MNDIPLHPLAMLENNKGELYVARFLYGPGPIQEARLQSEAKYSQKDVSIESYKGKYYHISSSSSSSS